MVSSVNKTILIGNVGKDPEIKSLQNGARVCNFSIATSESWKDKQSGERKEKTEWHRVVVFNEPLISVIERFINKGSKVYVEGQLETRKYTNSSGVEQYSTEVVLRPFRGEIQILDSKTKEDAPFTPNPTTALPSFDDEIPFAFAGNLMAPVLAFLGIVSLVC